jgi:hypothetical protein
MCLNTLWELGISAGMKLLLIIHFCWSVCVAVILSVSSCSTNTGEGSLRYGHIDTSNATKPLNRQLQQHSTLHAVYVYITLRRVGITIFAVNKDKYHVFWVCVCSFSYPACNALVPYLYCHLCPVWFYHVFRNYLTNGTIKKNIECKMCFDFLYTFFFKYFSFWKELSKILL